MVRRRGGSDVGRRGLSRWRRDGRWGNGSSRNHVVVIVVFLSGQREGLSKLGVDGLAPELQVKVCPGAIVLVDLGVFDNDCPLSETRFAPVEEVSVGTVIGFSVIVTYQWTTLMKVQSS